MIGLVIIGRNEGERLRRCLGSGLSCFDFTVYVDSGSMDGSVRVAREFGVEVVELDPARPFTAARARNEGLKRLTASHPEIEFVQFLDGDCELAERWTDGAVEEMRARPDVAVVCGRLSERNPDRTVYNRLCHLEFDRPAGEVRTCGGIFLARPATLLAVGGFREDLIAGEEPELCIRLRKAGYRIWRSEAAMATHDAEMTRLLQWFRRAVRAGHAYAERAALHRERDDLRSVASALVWGGLLPLAGVALAYWTRGWSLAGLAVLLGLLTARIALRAGRRWSARDARLYAVFCVLGKFAHVIGIMRFLVNRMTGRRPKLIEYRAIPPSGAGPR